MTRFTRILAGLLAALMLSGMIGCSDGGDTTVQTTAAPTVTTAPAETEAPETEPVDPRLLVTDDLPADLTFEGRTFNIYVGDKMRNRKYVGGPEETTGELVEDSVYRRNLAVEERLKITIEATGFDDSYNTIANSVSKLIMANDQTYDLFVGQQFGMTSVVNQQLFVNANELPHINLSQPWWDHSYMEEMALGQDRVYLLAGDFCLAALEWTDVLIFNKTFYQDQFGDPNELYQKALDGNWLFEDMHKLVSESFSDLNNNGGGDVDDRLGFVGYKMYATTDPFVYGSNVDFTIRDKDGYIQLNMSGNEKGIQLLEALLAFFWQDAVQTETGDNAGATKIFKEGRSLFMSGMYNSLEGLRDMDQDFGLLVYPKSEASQESYHSLVHDVALIAGVPISSLNHDMTGAVLEALGSESYRTVYPAYYETTLKVKYVRDDISSQIVDLIKDTKTTNFIYAYTTSLGDIGRVYRNLISGKSNNYASSVKAYQRMAERKMEQLVANFEQQK